MAGRSRRDCGMLFLAAVDRFTREELLDLLAFARAVTGLAPVRQSAEAQAAWLARGLSRAGRSVGGWLGRLGNGVDKPARRLTLWTKGLKGLAAPGRLPWKAWSSRLSS